MTATAPAPIYLRRPPSGLLARLYHCFPLHDGRWVAYAKQEERRVLETSIGDTDLGQLHAGLVQTIQSMTGEDHETVEARVNRAWLRIAAVILAEGEAS